MEQPLPDLDSKRSEKRPFGVTIIIIFQAFSVLVQIIELVSISLGNLPEGVVLQGEYSLVIFCFILVLSILLGAFLVYGLVTTRRWAWVYIMLYLGTQLSIDLVSYLNGATPYTSMLINIGMVFYLNQREVQSAFDQRPRGEPQ